jgi:hypothetical protein
VTDRHAAYVVVLEEDIRVDDAQEILTALRMVRGVAAVEPVISSFEVHVAKSRVDVSWRRALANLLRTGPPD